MIEEKLKSLGIELPEAPAAVAAYVSVKRTGNLIVTSGQLPWKGKDLLHKGKLGDDISDDEGYQCARQCAINAMAQLKKEVGDLDQISGIIKIEGYVHCASGFRGHPQVLNGASDLFNEVFGDAGQHTRVALGIADMPLDAPVQLVVWAEIKDRYEGENLVYG